MPPKRGGGFDGKGSAVRPLELPASGLPPQRGGVLLKVTLPLTGLLFLSALKSLNL